MSVQHRSKGPQLRRANSARSVIWIILASLLLTTGGCSPVVTEMTPEIVVEERARTQAMALREGDYELAMSFTVPSYQNSIASVRYAADRANAARWKSVEVKNVACEPPVKPTVCDVRLVVQANLPPLDIGLIARAA